MKAGGGGNRQFSEEAVVPERHGKPEPRLWQRAGARGTDLSDTRGWGGCPRAQGLTRLRQLHEWMVVWLPGLRNAEGGAVPCVLINSAVKYQLAKCACRPGPSLQSHFLTLFPLAVYSLASHFIAVSINWSFPRFT